MKRTIKDIPKIDGKLRREISNMVTENVVDKLCIFGTDKKEIISASKAILEKSKYFKGT